MAGNSNLFQTDFLITSIDHYGNKVPKLSEEDLKRLITKLYSFLAENPNSNVLLQSNFAYWLTYALQCALNLYDENAAQLICTLLYKLYNDKNPELLVSILAQTLRGQFAGQTVAYALMDNLFSGTYDSRNNSVVVAISYIFTQLLEKRGDSFSSVVAKNIEEGNEKGKNSLLVLARALANAASIPNNQPTTELIAELFSNFVKKSPGIISAALAQEIIYSSFKGKSAVYILASAIKNAVEDNPKVVQILSRILIDVNKILPDALVNSLCKIHEIGPYKGKHVLHIILTSLVSAAYINKNSGALSALTDAIHRIWEHNSDGKINLALMRTINEGEHADLNGIMMIVRALIAAIDHQLQISPITNFLNDFIKSDPKELGSAFTHQAPKSTVGDYTVSPLMLLINALKNKTIPPQQHSTLSKIIRNLASSKSAADMLFSLVGEPKSVFVNELGILYSLDQEEIVRLIGTENKEANSVSVGSRFFLTKNNQGGGQLFFQPASLIDEENRTKKIKDEGKSMGITSL